MPRYFLTVVTTVSKGIGEVVACDEEAARELGYKSREFRSLGGLCSHCTKSLGDLGDHEISVEPLDFEEDLREVANKLAYYLRVYIHAHETGNSVPRMFDAQARVAVEGWADPAKLGG